MKLKPILKWVGGKRQLLNDISPIIQKYTSKLTQFTYIEPFMGGGHYYGIS